MLNLLAPFLGSLTSGIFGLAGAQQSAASQQRANLINASLTQANNEANRAAQAAANAQTHAEWKYGMAQSMRQFGVSTQMAREQFAESVNQANIDRQLQKEFAQQGIQWRADDARAAGIHPLAAMGAQLASAAPISIAGNVPSGSVPGPGNYGVTPGQAPHFQSENFRGQALANMGQDISRAITASANEYQRQQEVNGAAQLLKLENMSLENQLLQAQIARTRGAGIVGPSMPGGPRVVGSGSVVSSQGDTKKVPVEFNAGVGPNQSQEGVTNPDISYGRSSTGYPVENPKILADTGEDDVFAQVARAVRNRILPSFGVNQNPPAHIPLAKDEYWFFNPVLQEYQKRRHGPPVDARNFNWGY